MAWAGRHYPKFDYLPQVFRAKSLLTNLSAGNRRRLLLQHDGISRREPERRCCRRSCGGIWTAMRRAAGSANASPPCATCLRSSKCRPWISQTYLPGDILVKVDRATMIHSLEARAPWLDYRIVELACGLPSGWKLEGRVGKSIFKQVVLPLLPEAQRDAARRWASRFRWPSGSAPA